MEKRTIWVVGGDTRQKALAGLLARDGHKVHLAETGEEQGVSSADWVIFPVGRQQTDAVLEKMVPRQLLFAGRMDGASMKTARERGVRVLDYSAREEWAVANAVPTAEGALQIAMEEMPITIHSARVMLIGFGRVGRMTAQRFGALGAKVTVAARKYDQLAWARAMGFDTVLIREIGEGLGSCDLVVNTVPAPVLGRAELEKLGKDCLVLDLASQPGGVDREAAEKLGRRVIHALALPGKVAPVTAGAAIRDAIYHMLEEYQGKSPERNDP